MIDSGLLPLAEAVLAACRAAGLRVATAESCTGGLLAATLTAIAGSSEVLERGFVTYANAAKTDLLDVPPELIERMGAVSEPVARAMAAGALAHSEADLAVATTGIAGPGGGSAEKPVGLVCFALARRNGGEPTSLSRVFPGGRAAVRQASVGEALALLLAAARRA
jgi:nicotinamide-nucleotide amidase